METPDSFVAKYRMKWFRLYKRLLLCYLFLKKYSRCIEKVRKKKTTCTHYLNHRIFSDSQAKGK